jgi:hypothetical protein
VYVSLFEGTIFKMRQKQSFLCACHTHRETRMYVGISDDIMEMWGKRGL